MYSNTWSLELGSHSEIVVSFAICTLLPCVCVVCVCVYENHRLCIVRCIIVERKRFAV
jgi:hypothetical protein